MTAFGRMSFTLKSYAQFLILLAGSLLGQVITLFQSSKPIFPCGPVLTFLGKIHLSVMCDVSFYMRDAQDLNRLRYFAMSADQYGTVFQERPLMAFTAKLFSYIFSPFPFLNHSQTYSGLDKIAIQYSIPIYISYILLNVIFMVFGLMLILKLFLGAGWKRPFSSKSSSLLLLIIVIYAFNRLMTYYFWIPNSDILNSVFAAYLAYLTYKFAEIKNSKYFYFHLLALSIASLFYGLFLVGTMVIFISLIIRKAYYKSFFAFLAMAPFFVWPLIIRISGGTYVNYETSKFRMFIWFFDGVKDGTILKVGSANFVMLLRSFEIPPLVIIFFGLFLLIRHTLANPPPRRRMLSQAFKSTLFWSTLGYAAWIYLIGLYEPRFTWGFSLFLILIIWKKIFDENHFKERSTSLILGLASIVWFSGWAIFTGPYY